MIILALGDVVGAPGRRALKDLLPGVIKEENIDFVIANCENAAGGSGITLPILDELFSSAIDLITSGDHIWKRKEIFPALDEEKALLRPANYPTGVPGRGHTIVESKSGIKVGVINLVGRTFMQAVECPFRVARSLTKEIKKQTPIVLVDFHAEATSEKIAMFWYLNGTVSGLFGTHTHVVTADEKVSPEGTAYITDLGMTGPHQGIIGRKQEQIIERFLTGLPTRFEMATDDVRLQGVIVEIDEKTGKALKIKRLQKSL